MFDNESVATFEEKLRAVVRTLAQLLRLPTSTKRSRKFLLAEGTASSNAQQPAPTPVVKGVKNPHLHPEAWGVPFQQFEVEKVFTVQSAADKAKGSHSFIRKRAQAGGGPCAYGERRGSAPPNWQNAPPN